MHATDSAYAQCAVDVRARPLPGNPMPPAPRRELFTLGHMVTVVNADGSVDERVTRNVGGTSDKAFDATLLDAVRRWRFQPARRDGVPVRSVVEVLLMSNMRVDTLPQRVEWRYAEGDGADTLHGTWVTQPAPAPLTAEETDSIHLAVLRNLVATRVLSPRVWHYPTRCIVSEVRDSAAHGRFNRLADAVIPTHGPSSAFAPYGCERTVDALRIVLPHPHRTDEDRAVVNASGDLLLEWPPPFDGDDYPGWTARCVSTVSVTGSAVADCLTRPKGGALGRGRREEPAVTATLAGGDSLRVTLVANPGGGVRNDTLRLTLHEVPRWDGRGWVNPDLPPVQPAHFILRLDDFSPGPSPGSPLRMPIRLYTNPAPADLVPLVMVLVNGRNSTYPMRPRGTGVWELDFGFGGDYRPPLEYRVYLLRRER